MADNPDKCKIRVVQEDPLSVRPTVLELDILLDSVSELRRLGLHLLENHYTPNNIREIEESGSSLADRKIALFEKWLKVDPYPSWSKVIAALKTIGEHTLAEQVSETKKSKLVTNNVM